MAEYLVFLDESGDDNLQNIDPRYPVFVLGAVVIEKGYRRTPLTRCRSSPLSKPAT